MMLSAQLKREDNSQVPPQGILLQTNVRTNERMNEQTNNQSINPLDTVAQKRFEFFPINLYQRLFARSIKMANGIIICAFGKSFLNFVVTYKHITANAATVLTATEFALSFNYKILIHKREREKN